MIHFCSGFLLSNHLSCYLFTQWYLRLALILVTCMTTANKINQPFLHLDSIQLPVRYSQFYQLVPVHPWGAAMTYILLYKRWARSFYYVYETTCWMPSLIYNSCHLITLFVQKLSESNRSRSSWVIYRDLNYIPSKKSSTVAGKKSETLKNQTKPAKTNLPTSLVLLVWTRSSA